MKKIIIFLLTVLTGLSISAQTVSTVKKVKVQRAEQYSLSHAAFISNPHNNYRFTVVQSKPINGKAPRTQFRLAADKFGFSALVSFMTVTVNGFHNSVISPKAEHLTSWQKKGKAGMDLKLNFDGAKLILRLYMRDDSPVLWGSVIPVKESLEPLKTIKLRFNAVISTIAKVNGKVARSKVYDRVAITPVRTLKQQRDAWQLTPADTYLVLQDNKYDGSTADKGQGPIMIILDHSAVKDAKLALRNEWLTSLDLELKPDSKSFDFGLWQQKPAISNKAFLEKLKKNKQAFQREITK